MNSELHPIGRALIVFGAILMGMGVLVLCAPQWPWLGRLPGDIVIRRDRFSFYFPLASSLLASVMLTLVLWLIGRFRQ